jgi:hypothetical protein
MYFFETGSHYVVHAGLELMIFLVGLPSARITGVYHHIWPYVRVLKAPAMLQHLNYLEFMSVYGTKLGGVYFLGK